MDNRAELAKAFSESFETRKRADGYVDVYNAARVAWLAEMPLVRGPLCEEAADEMGIKSSDVFELIGLGQYEWARRIFDAIRSAIEEQAEETEEEAD